MTNPPLNTGASAAGEREAIVAAIGEGLRQWTVKHNGGVITSGMKREMAACILEQPAISAAFLSTPANMVAELAREAQDWRHNGYTRVYLAQLHDRLASLSSASHSVAGAGCPASPDHEDIAETIANAADDWKAKGYTSALAEVRDMANVGRALMEALPEGYSYNDCPSEIVADLINERDEGLSGQSADGAEAMSKALEPFAAVADEYDDGEDDNFEVWMDAGPQRNIRSTFKLGMYRRAREAIRALPLPAAQARTVPEEVVRRAVARCIEIVREKQEEFLSPDYAADQPVGSFQERFACGQCADAISDEFAMGTNEQCRLLGKPTPGEQYRAALSSGEGEKRGG